MDLKSDALPIESPHQWDAEKIKSFLSSQIAKHSIVGRLIIKHAPFYYSLFKK